MSSAPAKIDMAALAKLRKETSLSMARYAAARRQTPFPHEFISTTLA